MTMFALTPGHFLMLGAALFCISVAGIFINRKNVIVLLMCLELLLLAVNINFVTFSRQFGGPARQGFLFFILAVALRRIHDATHSTLSVNGLAREAGMSRSAFFESFKSALGCSPMEYARAWRLAVARDLLMRGELTNAEIAHRVGYGSASAFAMAFLRNEGISPGRFAERQMSA